jgi:hypothetical protein
MGNFAMVRCAVLILAGLVTAQPAMADRVEIEASADATLIEHPTGAYANGAGSGLFVGRTGQQANALRRALLYFDVAAALPSNAIVERVELHLVARNQRPAAELSLHKVVADWGEGDSWASGGSGAPSQPGDATWVHRFFDEEGWAKPGGHFAAGPRASTTVGTPGLQVWGSTPQMVADVRHWLRSPQTNFGWILLGDEGEPRSALRFESRESGTAANRPVLIVDYRLTGPGRR